MHPIGLGRIFLSPLPKGLVQETRRFRVVRLDSRLLEDVDPAIESAQRRRIRVGAEDGGSVSLSVQVFGHGGGALGNRRRVSAVPAQHAVMKRGHKGGGRGFRPRRVAERALEEDSLSGQTLEVGRGAPVVPVGAHKIGARPIDNVEDDVGVGARSFPAESRRRPEGHGALTFRLRFEGDRHHLAFHV